MRLWLGAAALVCLPLCAARADAPAPPPDTCHLTQGTRYIGARAVPQVRRMIGQLNRPQPVRWIAPGQAITLDYNDRRLNVILDEDGRIAVMRCG